MKSNSKELARGESTRSLTPLFSDVERWFDDFLPRRNMSLLNLPVLRPLISEDLVPVVDIFEEKGDIVLKAEIPGMNKDDIDITLTEDSITISGEKSSSEEIKKTDYYRSETSYGSFSRTFMLPSDVQMNKVTSKYNDGILEIRMPKSEEAKKKEVKLHIQ
jgi:HSP20 family protein